MNKSVKSICFYCNGDEYIQYEFHYNQIAIVRWKLQPKSTIKWIKPSPGKYRLEGTTNKDLHLIIMPYDYSNDQGQCN